MKTTAKKILLGIIATGCAGSTASIASAQAPYLVNISGATLLRNFLVAPASTNDFIDCNNNGATGEQLAPAGTGLAVPNQLWQVQYRGVGSVNGFIELRDWGTIYAVGANGVEVAASAASEGGFHNRTTYINNGMPTGPANNANPGAAPARSLQDGTFRVTTSTDPLTTGILMDIAPLDVPVSWAVQADGVPAPTRTPTAPGYGQNPRIAVNTDGTATTQTNMLPEIGILNTNFGSPDQFTVYDTALALAPVAAIVNYGAGVREVTYTDLQWLCSTGRMPTGENLVFVTRDVGSGTRNAFQNSICIDPSWGIGENVGPFTSSSSRDLLGPNFTPSNKGSSSRNEGTVFNHRLAIGYSGAERAVNNAYLGVRADVLGVRNDLMGGTVFARPTINNVLDNDVNGYNITGPAVLSTIGDPRAEAIADGGDANGNPMMANAEAACYVNNITRSVAAFKAVPGGDETLFSPGEFLAANFLLTTAPDFIQDILDPCNLIANPNLNQTLQDFTRNNSVLSNAGYAAFNNTATGNVPTRTTGITYTDGVVGGGTYRTQAGAAVSYGSVVSLRNKISGDFNNDGLRDINDTAEMMSAWRDRNGGPAWQAGTNAIVEVLGDFNGDGNFDAADVRYFADGLARVSVGATIDRRAGFTAVDAAFGGNFFGTTLATGAAYANGASRADVAGPSGLQTPGFAPIGADGVVDAYDIDYVCANFGDWSVLEDAVQIDFSCDMNGDGVIDGADVAEIVEVILGTSFGDANLDGVVDATDEGIVMANLGMAGGWSQGDFNCDGVVDANDLAFFNNCPADLSGDGQVSASDLALLLGAWGPGSGPADLNNDGQVTAADLALMLGAWGACN